MGEVGAPGGAPTEELRILERAMEVERKGYGMYSRAAAEMASPRAKELFEHLAAEEQTHFQLLTNTHDYLADPEGWNGFNEGPMLDGG
jgi:rubrerythrin